MVESLSGLIERVTFHNQDTGFAVLKVKAKGAVDSLVPAGAGLNRVLFEATREGQDPHRLCACTSTADVDRLLADRSGRVNCF